MGNVYTAPVPATWVCISIECLGVRKIRISQNTNNLTARSPYVAARRPKHASLWCCCAARSRGHLFQHATRNHDPSIHVNEAPRERYLLRPRCQRDLSDVAGSGTYE